MDEVSDERLVGGLRELLRAEGQTEARIVAHLAEVDARRLHLKGAQSLFEYCQRSLGLSDSQAYYRIAAARVARRFPILFELLERREIHLTNVAPISKYLTEENHVALLREAGRLSKRELLKELARRAPRPDVVSEIRRLIPAAGAFAAGPTGSLEPLSDTSYRLQLNTSESLKEKLELARDLMSHANPSGDLAVVVERAVDLLIERLKSRRVGQTSRPRPRNRRDEAKANESHLDRSKSGHRDARKHISNETRRSLVARDGLCCSYVNEDGQRCASSAFLQIHHDRAWAKGGANTIDNLRLLCSAHNQLLAEQEYGGSHVMVARATAAMERKRGVVRTRECEAGSG